MGVYDLVSECAGRQVGPLGDVEQFIHVGSLYDSTANGPESAQNSEQGTFAAAVGSANDSAHAPVDFQG